MLAVPKQLDIFSSRLPHAPYCSDDLSFGLDIRRKQHAVQKRYIQHNPPPTIAYLIFDLDRPDSCFAWSDAFLPVPAWVAVNPENGHSHIAYGLSAPVCRTNAALAAPLKLAAAIEAAYTEALNADRGYTGLITKNPLHKHWKTFFPATEAANFGSYELSELAEYVTLPKKLSKKSERIGVGRNVSLFDELRYWAYRAVREYWRPGGFKAWQSAVMLKSEKLNNFPEPLPCSECAGIARSVAKWVWKNTTPDSFHEFIQETHTQEIQAKRGRRSGVVRAAKATEKAAKAQEMKGQGMSPTEIAKELKCGVSSVYRWLSHEPISDDSPAGGCLVGFL